MLLYECTTWTLTKGIAREKARCYMLFWTDIEVLLLAWFTSLAHGLKIHGFQIVQNFWLTLVLHKQPIVFCIDQKLII